MNKSLSVFEKHYAGLKGSVATEGSVELTLARVSHLMDFIFIGVPDPVYLNNSLYMFSKLKSGSIVTKSPADAALFLLFKLYEQDNVLLSYTDKDKTPEDVLRSSVLCCVDTYVECNCTDGTYVTITSRVECDSSKLKAFEGHYTPVISNKYPNVEQRVRSALITAAYAPCELVADLQTDMSTLRLPVILTNFFNGEYVIEDMQMFTWYILWRLFVEHDILLPNILQTPFDKLLYKESRVNDDGSIVFNSVVRVVVGHTPTDGYMPEPM